jgi:hypothetical protein
MLCYINLITNAIGSYPDSSNKNIFKEVGGITFVYTMSNRASNVPATAITKSLGGKKPFPKRGQIKSRIAAHAFHSIVSLLSKASSDRQHSSRETNRRET